MPTSEPPTDPAAGLSAGGLSGGGGAPDVSVVVVSWNGAHLLPPCLDALLAQDVAGRRVEIVVVDNGSSDGSVDLVRSRYPQVRVIALPRNTGFGAGANRGIESSAAPFVVLVNNDAVCEPGFIAELLAGFAGPGGERVGAVTARIVLAQRYRPVSADTPGALVGHDGRRWAPCDNSSPDGEELLNSTGSEITVSGNGRDRGWLDPVESGRLASSDVFGFCGGAAALRRSALDDVGVFEESLFLYYEDTDLSWRLRRRGWSVRYAADAVARHRHAASSGTGSEFFLRHNEKNRLVVALRNAPWGVVGRAFGRFLGRAALDVALGRGARGARGRGAQARGARGARAARRHASSLGYVVARLPALLRQRRALARAATVSHSELARYLVPDGPGQRATRG